MTREFGKKSPFNDLAIEALRKCGKQFFGRVATHATMGRSYHAIDGLLYVASVGVETLQIIQDH